MCAWQSLATGSAHWRPGTKRMGGETASAADVEGHAWCGVAVGFGGDKLVAQKGAGKMPCMCDACVLESNKSLVVSLVEDDN